MLITRGHSGLAILFGLWALASLPADAQAWVPFRGQGAVTVGYQRIAHNGHRATDGAADHLGTSLNMSAFIEADYGLTDRLSFTIGLPYVWGKFTGSNPPPPGFVRPPQDSCRCWQSTWQDFGFTMHYNAMRLRDGTFSLTPSVSLGIPSHNYWYSGESVAGRDLKELTLAVDAGQRLDFLTPKLYVAGRYSYGIVQRVLDIPNNRSLVSIEGSYFLLDGRLVLRALTIWQRTHGGLRLGSPPPSDLVRPGEANTPELKSEHHRMLRDNYFRAGGGATYSFRRLDVFGSYIYNVSGTDTHLGNVFTAGVSWPFEWHWRR